MRFYPLRPACENGNPESSAFLDSLKFEGAQGDFAGLCGRSPELIAGIIAGEASIDAATAAEFERRLGLAAHIWLGMDQGYREGLAQGKQVAALARETVD